MRIIGTMALISQCSAKPDHTPFFFQHCDYYIAVVLVLEVLEVMESQYLVFQITLPKRHLWRTHRVIHRSNTQRIQSEMIKDEMWMWILANLKNDVLLWSAKVGGGRWNLMTNSTNIKLQTVWSFFKKLINNSYDSFRVHCRNRKRRKEGVEEQ